MRLTEPGQDFEIQFCRECGCEYYGEPEGCNHPNYVCPSNCYFTTVAEKLQKYEDLEEQGQLVRLPCKVGDPLYWIDGDNDNEIVELTVIEFRYDLNDRLICRAEYADKTDYVDLFDFEFGKTVFLSHEDAEAAVEGAEHATN